MKEEKVTPKNEVLPSEMSVTEPTQPQPSAGLKDRAKKLAREIVHTFVPRTELLERAERICEITGKLESFASSIQEADRQEREEIMQALGISYDAELAAEQGDAYELAAEPEPLYFDTLPKAVANFSVLMEREFSKLEQQLAEARAQVSTAEIHNRFCGENGEPCQACKLKAERAAQTPPASQDGTASKEKS